MLLLLLQAPRRGKELTISYGDKGNEELLLLHGFAVADNPHDTLMVPCPLPSSDQWGGDTTARVQLLQVAFEWKVLKASATAFTCPSYADVNTCILGFGHQDGC